MKYCLSAFILSAALTPAYAGSVVDGAGVWTGTVSADVHQISEGHMIIHTNNAYEAATMSDPNNPMAGMSGPCFGSVEVKGTSASGTGNCVFRAGRNAMTVQWTATGFAASGALIGHWSITGGAGDLANATGGGTFYSLTDQAAGTFENTLKGAMSLN